MAKTIFWVENTKKNRSRKKWWQIWKSVIQIENKKAKDVNRNVAAAIGHNEYKDVLLYKKCLRHSMNRIQSKDHRIETYQINRISLSRFDDKIFI